MLYHLALQPANYAAYWSPNFDAGSGPDNANQYLLALGTGSDAEAQTASVTISAWRDADTCHAQATATVSAAGSTQIYAGRTVVNAGEFPARELISVPGFFAVNFHECPTASYAWEGSYGNLTGVPMDAWLVAARQP